MRKIFSLLILTSSLFVACQRTSQQGVRQLSSADSVPVNPNSIASPKPTPKENTATVISLHANLRAEDNSKSAVLEVVPQDTSVEVIKQQGAWFLVKTDTNQQGWLHGNTIKLQSFNTKVMTVEPLPIVKPKTTIETNDSGATAKCRDGTLSYSAHRQGTCSHHGGVAVWY